MALTALLVSMLPGAKVPTLSRQSFLFGVVPIAFCTAFDVAASQWGLDLLSVSVYTVLKGTVPAFTLLFALLFGLEKLSLAICGSIFIVTLGIMLCAAGSEEDAPESKKETTVEGILTVLIACSMAGLRWSLAQVLMTGKDGAEGVEANEAMHNGQGGIDMADDAARLKGGESNGRSEPDGLAEEYGLDEREEEGVEQDLQPLSPSSSRGGRRGEKLQSPLSMILRIAPTTVIFLLPATVAIESGKIMELNFSTDAWLEICACLAVVSLLVFSLLFLEYYLVQLASSLTLSVLGIAKELVTILIAIVMLGDWLTPLSFSGFALATCGIMAYNFVKWGVATDREVLALLRGVKKEGMDYKYTPVPTEETEGR
eukprot:scaffold4019_cov260-Pinguiococcus_pyrenoidosus.AAC.3